ncbi:Uncharacterised protein [uncultured archaeon]|nr:Uncharacterised protein [uncultured archaeon]
MKVLVGFEFSQTITQAFRARGHEAFSCDLLPTEGNQEWHLQGDIFEVLDELRKRGWIPDMVFGHPECTRLCNSGVRWLHERNLWEDMRQAAELFRRVLNLDVQRICIENPIPHRYALEIIGRKYDQIIQPWQFGEDASKATCLWMKNLPKLEPTNILLKDRYSNQTPTGQNRLAPSDHRAKDRARTYRGIAEGMAAQWNF